MAEDDEKEFAAVVGEDASAREEEGIGEVEYDSELSDDEE